MTLEIIQPLINGILLGGLYAIIGIGMFMIFGIMRLTNLAHGDLMVLASYLCLTITSSLGINPIFALIIVIPIMFILGYLLQTSLLSKVLRKGAEPPLLLTFGTSIILQNALLLVFSPDAKTILSIFSAKTIKISDSIGIPIVYLIDFLVGVLVIILLSLFLKRTYVGRAIRAASDDKDVAELVGVNTKRIYGITMGIAMVTAAISGLLVGMTFTFYPHTGTQYLIIAFGVVVIGGLGSLGGTLVAGIILGLAQLLGAHFFGNGLQLLFGYIVLMLVLILRPQGIFAKT